MVVRSDNAYGGSGPMNGDRGYRGVGAAMAISTVSDGRNRDW